MQRNWSPPGQKNFVPPELVMVTHPDLLSAAAKHCSLATDQIPVSTRCLSFLSTICWSLASRCGLSHIDEERQTRLLLSALWYGEAMRSEDRFTNTKKWKLYTEKWELYVWLALLIPA